MSLSRYSVGWLQLLCFNCGCAFHRNSEMSGFPPELRKKSPLKILWASLRRVSRIKIFFGIMLENRTFFGGMLEFFGVDTQLFEPFELISFRSSGGKHSGLICS